MKKVLILATLLAFVVSAPIAMAAEKPAKEKQINCCVDGKCEKMTKKACKEAKGKVVRDCKACKPVQINCCVNGKCEKMTKKACTDAGGKVVKSCKACKPAK